MLALAALAGFADSVYLTLAHYSSAPLACVNAGAVNCDLVTRSSYGLVPGTSLPVSAAGIAWFLVSLVLALVAGRRAAMALLGWAGIGALVVLYLVYAEMRLGHICEWCTLVHALVLLTLLLSVARVSAPAGAGAPPAGSRS